MIATMVTFSTNHIALTAGVTGLISLPLAYSMLRPRSWVDAMAVALVTAASVFVFRKSANLGQLNDDGLSPFSANDWLAPVLTYVFLGVYAALRPRRLTRREFHVSGRCSRWFRSQSTS